MNASVDATATVTAIHCGPSVADSSTRISNTNPAVVGLMPGTSCSRATDAATAVIAATTRMPSGTEERRDTELYSHFDIANAAASRRTRLLWILYGLLMGDDSTLDEKAIMLTLVQIRHAATSSREAASLVADYMAFDRRRTSRRQYQKAFGGLAVIVLLGALFGRVPADEAAVVGGLLIVPPMALAIVELFHWRRLMRRLDHVRAEVRSVRKL